MELSKGVIVRSVRCYLAPSFHQSEWALDRDRYMRSTNRGVAGTPSNKAAGIGQSGVHIASHCLPRCTTLPTDLGISIALLELAVNFF